MSLQNKIWTTLLSLSVIVQMSLTLTYFVYLKESPLFAETGEGTPLLIVKVVMLVAGMNEIAISGSLLYLLQRHRAGTSFLQSESILKRIVWLIGASSLIIVAFGLTSTLFLWIAPQSVGHIALQLNSSKCRAT